MHRLLYATWHPDGKRATLWIDGESNLAPAFGPYQLLEVLLSSR